MIDFETFAQMWGEARRRVLTRYAVLARESATDLLQRSDRFPDDAAAMRDEADRLGVYADECDAAAEDPALPTPEYQSMIGDAR